jgi:DNA-binding NarL/FixJ family response regulator
MSRTVRRVAPVTVLIVDDEASFRAAARGVVAASPGFDPVGEAASAEEALETARELEPDLMLVDLSMPGLDGLETSSRLGAVLPGAVIVLVAVDGGPSPDKRGAQGVSAFIRRDELTPGALRAIWNEHGRSGALARDQIDSPP